MEKILLIRTKQRAELREVGQSSFLKTESEASRTRTNTKDIMKILTVIAFIAAKN